MDTPPKMRQLMPEGFLAILADRTGSMSMQGLSQIVRFERVTSKHWPAVAQLAQETNPTGFAAWQAAKGVPVPA